MRTRVLALSLLLFAAACAASAGGGGGGGGGNLNLLTTADLEAGAISPREPLYEMIERLRPRWFQVRRSTPNPIVFIDLAAPSVPGTPRALDLRARELLQSCYTALDRTGILLTWDDCVGISFRDCFGGDPECIRPHGDSRRHPVCKESRVLALRAALLDSLALLGAPAPKGDFLAGQLVYLAWKNDELDKAPERERDSCWRAGAAAREGPCPEWFAPPDARLSPRRRRAITPPTAIPGPLSPIPYPLYGVCGAVPL